ncbi:DUF3855 domain-containing protein [Thermotoga sp. KOL6]|uniref:DUF3855 domain-containing protein n=1 Tax=Thermotoga sp. KOL6 TaxID=126741 RepID=UPI000C7847F4|nr:DUF3855 domain-containing protein [Thermotoga sp. KOL6]PLV58355.1 hypothetical protein AS005_08300 [Thermotoga sp. KOL6]
MRLMDNLEIVYRKRGRKFGDLEKKMREILKETGVSLEIVNSEVMGKLSLKINILDDYEKPPAFVMRVLTSESNAMNLPLGEWTNLENIFVEEIDFLDEYEAMKIHSDGDKYTIYIPFSVVRKINRNDVVAKFMEYFFKTKNWDTNDYEISVREVDNIF